MHVDNYLLSYILYTGLVINPLRKCFDWATIGFIGCALMCAGAVGTAYCHNLYGLYMTYGVLMGE